MERGLLVRTTYYLDKNIATFALGFRLFRENIIRFCGKYAAFYRCRDVSSYCFECNSSCRENYFQ